MDLRAQLAPQVISAQQEVQEQPALPVRTDRLVPRDQPEQWVLQDQPVIQDQPERMVQQELQGQPDKLVPPDLPVARELQAPMVPRAQLAQRVIMVLLDLRAIQGHLVRLGLLAALVPPAPMVRPVAPAQPAPRAEMVRQDQLETLAVTAQQALLDPQD